VDDAHSMVGALLLAAWGAALRRGAGMSMPTVSEQTPDDDDEE
jgi:hypothetical protein